MLSMVAFVSRKVGVIRDGFWELMFNAVSESRVMRATIQVQFQVPGRAPRVWVAIRLLLRNE